MPLILAFIYIFLEVLVSFEVIALIGVFAFVLEIIITAFLGIFILVNFRLFLSDAINRLRCGALSYEAFVGSNIFRILGAILLILPGALTDILGILMQFSALGFMLVKPFVKAPKQRTQNTEQEIIDVEAEEIKK